MQRCSWPNPSDWDAQAILVEEQQCYYLTLSWKIKGVYTYPKSISLKVKRNSLT